MAPSDEWRQEGESPVRDVEFEAFPAAVAFAGMV
jgi:hypothetical protein